MSVKRPKYGGAVARNPRQYVVCLLVGLSLSLAGYVCRSAAKPPDRKLPVLWFELAFRQHHLERRYQIITPLKPSFLQADFNGDHRPDCAVLVIELKHKKKGILLMHRGLNTYYVFGAGHSFGNGSDNFDWLDQWRVWIKPTINETIIRNGDIAGSHSVSLKRPGILVEALEDGEPFSGGLIYWTGTRYRWIHQGE